MYLIIYCNTCGVHGNMARDVCGKIVKDPDMIMGWAIYDEMMIEMVQEVL